MGNSVARGEADAPGALPSYFAFFTFRISLVKKCMALVSGMDNKAASTVFNLQVHWPCKLGASAVG